MIAKTKLLTIIGWSWIAITSVLLLNKFGEKVTFYLAAIVFFLSPGLFALQWRRLLGKQEKSPLDLELGRAIILLSLSAVVVYFSRESLSTLPLFHD